MTTASIPLKPATAALLRDAIARETAARVAHERAIERLQDTLRPLLAEHDIASGRPTTLSDAAPYTLTIEVDDALPE